MMNYKRILIGSMISLCSFGCTAQSDVTNTSDKEKSAVTYDEDDYFETYDNATPIDLNNQNNDMTIQEAGTYLLSGSLQGTITITVKQTETVRLVLNNVDIQANDSAAIHCTQAKKLIISLPEGTMNTLSDAQDYTDTSENAPSSTIFAQDDLTINGTGTLHVKGNKNDGIISKDTLKLMEGSYEIAALDNGIVGRDYLYVRDGVYHMNVGKDGLKANYDKDDTKGDVIIENGSFDITSENDGIQAERALSIYGGSFQIVSGGGSENASTSANANQLSGFKRWNFEKNDNTETETLSAKGIKSSADLMIYDGVFNFDCSDDCIHANANVTIKGGEFTLLSGDDGIHADGTLSIEGGVVDVKKSYEGLEGSDVIIQAGDIAIVSMDDGINAAGGSDEETTQPSMDHFRAGNNTLQILGGTIHVDADGDGIDSNGEIIMEEGTLVIFGPSDNGNGAIDYEKSFMINGGTMIAVGFSGMAQGISQDSAQNAIMFNIPSQKADTLVYLSDANGNVLLGVQPTKAYDNIVISSAKLKDQSTYVLYCGGNSAEVNDAGIMESNIQGGEKCEEATISQRMTTVKESKGAQMDQRFDQPMGDGEMPQNGKPIQNDEEPPFDKEPPQF